MGPTLTNLCDITNLTDETQVVVIRSSQNYFDYTTFNSAYRYKENPLVKSDGYLHLMCTNIVWPEFTEKYESLDFSTPDIMYYSSLPCAMLCAFGSQVLEKYGKSPLYNCNLTKAQCVALESGIPLTIDNKTIPSFYSLGKRDTSKFLEEKIQDGTEDIYKTGTPRHKVKFPNFAVTKYLLRGHYGDFHNDIKIIHFQKYMNRKS